MKMPPEVEQHVRYYLAAGYDRHRLVTGGHHVRARLASGHVVPVNLRAVRAQVQHGAVTPDGTKAPGGGWVVWASARGERRAFAPVPVTHPDTARRGSRPGHHLVLLREVAVHPRNALEVTVQPVGPTP